MTQTERPNDRPDCEEILENTNEWTLNEKEFGVKDELEKVLKSTQNKERFLYSIIYFLNNSLSSQTQTQQETHRKKIYTLRQLLNIRKKLYS
jgi:hypothetical protein